MATIMVSAVAYVVTYESPGGGDSPTRDLLRQRAQDAITGLYETPVEGSSFGENMLSVLLAQCMGGDCGNLSDRLDRIMPAGSSYAVYVSNGYDTFPVYVERQPSGEAITATHLLEPAWSQSFVTTGMTQVNPASDPLVAYTLPIFNSNTLSQGGSPLRVIVHGTRLSDGANYTATGFFSTQAFDVADAGLHPAVSAYFVVDGVPAGKWDASGLAPTLGEQNLTLRLRVNESAGVPLAAGAEVTISMPRGWTGVALQADNPAWLVLSNATSSASGYTGSDVTARLLADVTGAAEDFVLHAVYHGDALEWYPIQARLSKGALAEANLLVKPNRSALPDSSFAVPQVAMSAPRPMGASATTTWTLTVDIPAKVDERVSLPRNTVRVQGNAATGVAQGAGHEASQTASAIAITSIEILEQDGANIFGSIEPLAGSGAWTNGKDRLVWTGYHLNDRGPLALTFEVDASGVAGAGGGKTPSVPPAQFETFKGRMLSQVAPGFYRGVFLPGTLGNEYPGYGNGTSGLGREYNFTSDSIFRSTSLPGSANYTINPVTSFQDSIHGSYVSVERRNVPVGGTAVLSADVQSLLFALSQAGISAGVNLNFYPPWAGDEKKPIYTQQNLDSGILGSDVTALMLMELNGDSFPDVVVGTSNGRVLALHGMTGARLQGTAFIASLQTSAPNGAATGITHLAPFHHKGKDYVVAATDKEGQSIYVLDTSLQEVWSYDKSGRNTLAVDASVDMTGDGENDILVGMDDSGVYVLTPPEDADDPYQRRLESYRGPDSDGVLEDAFYTTLGKPTALVGMQGIGPDATKPGFGVTFQSTPGMSPVDLEQDLVVEAPRAGFQGVSQSGAPTWTFFGSPITIAVPHDHDGDAATDVLAGSPAGYVHMLNGTAATQPLYSNLYVGQTVKDADGHDAFRQVILTDEGVVMFTTNGWVDSACAFCNGLGVPTALFPAARGVAMNGSASFWAVGGTNLMLRSIPGIGTDGGADASRPYLAVVTPNGTKDGAEGYFTTHTHHFNDVDFGRVPANDDGWVVAGKCVYTTDCDEALVMRTVDGGDEWRIYSHAQRNLMTFENATVREELTRINFTTESVGWIVGHGGTLLRTLDGGAEWLGVKTPTTEDIVDISCDAREPGRCILLTASKAWSTRNATVADRGHIGWTPIELDLVSTTSQLTVELPGVVQTVKPKTLYTRSLKSVGVIDDKVAYIGAENMVLKTLDGGQNWTSMPMNYLEAEANRIVAFPDGRGYLYGGNVSHTRVFFMHDYAMRSVAETGVIHDLGDGESVFRVEVEADFVSKSSDAAADILVSVDGGAHWQSVGLDTTSTEARTEGSLATYASTAAFVTPLGDDDEGGDVRLRIEFNTMGDQTLMTAQVRALKVRLYVHDPNDPESPVGIVERTLDLTQEATVDRSNTTAVWDTAHGVIHQSVVNEYWTRNVSGEVKALRSGLDVAGDAHPEVWVGTGGVLAANSPEHAIYAGSDLDKWMREDNRIYLLDGSNGTILARTASFAGNVTNLQLSGDGNGDGAPDYLYATTWDPARGNGTLEALNATTLEPIWTTWLDIYQPVGLVPGLSAGPFSSAIVGTRASESGQNAISGKVYSVRGADANINWAAVPDLQGKYVVTKAIPPSWFFGPYVVEVEVKWTSDLEDSQGNTAADDAVLQTARFYDYFLVTPPDALSPPSPVYQVHLVAWFDDWR